jgi:hypothetical protein
MSVISHRFSRRTFLAGAAGFSGLAIGGTAAFSAPDTRLYGARLGLNFIMTGINRDQIPQCIARRNKSAPLAGRAFLPQYDKGPIRSFTSLRHLIWFGEGPVLPENVFHVSRGREAGEKFAAFVEDARSAGFEELMLAFGPQAGSRPSCRKEQWGDCYDSRTASNSTDFVLSCRRQFVIATGFSLWVDLLNEGAPSDSTKGTHDAYVSYVRQTSSAYRSAFPRDKITVSIQANYVDQRLKWLSDEFYALGGTPDFFSIHIYKATTLGRLEQNLATFAAFVRKTGKPVFVGETDADPIFLRRIAGLLSDEHKLDVRSILIWPLRDRSSGCAMDIDADEVQLP